MKRETAINNLNILEQKIVSEEKARKNLVEQQLQLQNKQYECDAILYFKRRQI